METPDRELTTEEKLEQCWAMRQQDASEIESLKFTIAKMETQLKQAREQVDGVTLKAMRLRDERDQAITALNEANMRASTAVSDYIARQG